MNQKQLQTKYAYLLDDASLLPAEEVNGTPTITEEVKTEVVAEVKKTKEKKLNEGFDTHILCNNCNSGNLELSKKKTKIRCKECGNIGLTENVVGLINKRDK